MKISPRRPLGFWRWAMLLLLLTRVGGMPAIASSDAPVSLTPPTGPAPRINGPSVFGVRPHSPFFYAIPATGARPVTFSVQGLPEGLALDPNTGQITGKLVRAGTYPLLLSVRNRAGVATRKFRIVAGDDIALTPPMGWNDWNCWGARVDGDKILRAAKALVDTGLAEHGWSYVNIDDTWQGRRSGPDYALQANKKFPDMKGLCETLHSWGFKVGIYSTPWVMAYSGYPGGSGDDAQGSWPLKTPGFLTPAHHAGRIGEFSFAAADARQWADWGIDYLKYDWHPDHGPEIPEMASALRATGRDIVFSISNQSRFESVSFYGPLVNCWRTTTDITDTWKSMAAIGFSQGRWAPYSTPGHWNDPDMLEVGWVGMGNPRPTRLTPDEQHTHISLWCLLSAPLLMGCDLEKLDPFTLGLLSNDEVLAVDQDALGKPAVRIGGSAEGPTEVFAKQLEDGTRAVGLFNLGGTAADVTVSWSDLHLRENQPVRDLWRQHDLGTFPGNFSASVAPHGVVLVRVGKPSSAD